MEQEEGHGGGEQGTEAAEWQCWVLLVCGLVPAPALQAQRRPEMGLDKPAAQ